MVSRSGGDPMLISWDDVDRTEVAGWHPVKRLGITVNIRQQEIETWKDDPHGRFTVVEFSPLAGPRTYGLELFCPSGYVE
jgi:hypothetical protein